MIAPHRRWIVLSPHLDDAALSLGGLIAALTNFAPVEVWSLFCRASLTGPYSELADWLHASSGGLSGSRLAWARKLEDRIACRQLGATARHFGWKDAPYRRASDGSFLYRTTQPEVWHQEDSVLLAAMKRQLAAQVDRRDVVLSPLAIGRHVDHVITRAAAESLDGRPLLYYPEVPYAHLFPDQATEATRGLCEVPYVLRRDEVAKWVGSSISYATQVGMLERAAGPLRDLIYAYAEDRLRLFRDCTAESVDLTRYRIFT